MGLLTRHLYLLAIENEKHPIKGDVLTLGQQSVHATLSEVMALLKKTGASLENLPHGFDTKNKIPYWEGTKYESCANCQAVLTLLGAKKIVAADVSEYENPEIIMDFNAPVGKEYYNKFDTILDVGTLEHVFNIPQAFLNIKLMLKPKGTLILGYPASNAVNHGFYQISPTLLYDYFCSNGFENFSCFIINGSCLNYEKKAKIYQCKAGAITENLTLATKTGVEVMFFATKSANSNGNDLQNRIPIQTAYRTSTYWQKKTAPDWGKKGKLLPSLLFYSRKWRPEIIDRTWKKIKTNKMLTYLGKY